MPREWTSNLQTIHEAYKRRDTLDLYLNDDTAKHLSRGYVEREIGAKTEVYLNYIRSVGDLRYSFEGAVDRIEIICQNVNSELGFDLASNLRLLDYATADYGRVFQSARNLSLIEDIPQIFRGILADGTVDEKNFRFEFIVDYEALGAILASRGLSPRCWWDYQNGIECNSASELITCPKTRLGCIERGSEYEFGGVEFFEEPTSAPPGTGGGGGIGGGTCFTWDTFIWTPDGDIPIGKIQDRLNEGKRSIFSFDEMTGEIIEDEIEYVWKHENVTGYFSFYFDNSVLNVTSEHKLLADFGIWKIADKFSRTDTMKSFRKKWSDEKLTKIQWNSDKSETMFNLKVNKNETYFANNRAVSNSKDPGEL